MKLDEKVVMSVREHLRAMIYREPEFLLEQDGGPVGLQADLIMADLVGEDNQVELSLIDLQVPSGLPDTLRIPVPSPELSAIEDGDVIPFHDPRLIVATYVLQSSWASVEILADGFTMALVRYRKRDT